MYDKMFLTVSRRKHSKVKSGLGYTSDISDGTNILANSRLLNTII